jgi:serine protease inhibitor
MMEVASRMPLHSTRKRTMLTAAVRQSNTLTRRWAATATEDQSTAFAGAAVWPLLALLAAAADGAGREELETAVGLTGDEAVVAANELLAELDAMQGVRAALGIWTGDRVGLTDWWRQAVPSGACGRLTGDAIADQAVLDSWVREQTGGQLSGLPGLLGPEALLVLAAAINLRTKWLEPFENDMLMPQTGPWATRRLAGLRRGTPNLDEVALVQTPSGPITMLAVAGTDDLIVHLALGSEDRTASDVLTATLVAVDGAWPARLGSQLRAGDDAPGVIIGVPSYFNEPRLFSAVPRFSVQSAHDLVAEAELFGLATVSDPSRGHFPRLSTFPLALQAARQDVTASFSAEGFEAAAVTQVEMMAGGVPPRSPRSICVEFDRPFAFVVRMSRSGLVVLAGWIADAEDFWFWND